jgi:hypothetical protein
MVDANGRNLNLFKDNLNKEPENGLHLFSILISTSKTILAKSTRKNTPELSS